MKLLRGLITSQLFASGTVATIGNFDGVHLGHQALLSSLRAKANQLKLPMVVLLFEPQPNEYLHPNTAFTRLTSLREKLQIFKKYHVDYVYCLKFNRSLASMPPETFAKLYFFTLMKAKYLLVGEDFHFGQGRGGNINLLKQLGETMNCQIGIIPDFLVHHERVSSTNIRSHLATADFLRAKDLLGRNFSLSGRVIKGAGRGLMFGFPTANIKPRKQAPPLNGVFYVKVKRGTNQWLDGVANCGRRPTIDETQNSLEVHLLSFNDDLYGEVLQIFFIKKLRDTIKFKSIDNLIEQINIDIVSTKQLLYEEQTL